MKAQIIRIGKSNNDEGKVAQLWTESRHNVGSAGNYNFPPTHPPPPLQVPIFLLPGHYCLPTRFPCLQVHLEEGTALPRPGFVFNSHATANDHDLTKGRPLINGTMMMLSTQLIVVVWGEKLVRLVRTNVSKTATSEPDQTTMGVQWSAAGR